MKSHWQLEKKEIQEIRKMKSDIEHAKVEAEKFEREGNLGKVAELRYGVITELENKMKQKTEELIRIQKNNKMLKEEVQPEDIAEVVAKWTGIPVSKMLESEKSKLVRMEKEIHKRVVGQDDAVSAV